MHAQRVRHSPSAPRLRHTAIAPGISPCARSISSSQTRAPGNAQVRSMGSGLAYSARSRRESESATVGSECGRSSQGVSSGASSAPPSACQRMAPSSAMLLWASLCSACRGRGEASAAHAPCASFGSRPSSTPCPSVRPRLPGAVARGSRAQPASAPKPANARTRASKAPPAPSRRLLIAAASLHSPLAALRPGAV